METTILAVADKLMSLPEEELNNERVLMITGATLSSTESFSKIAATILPIADPLKIRNLNDKVKDILSGYMTEALYALCSLAYLCNYDVSKFSDENVEDCVEEFDDLTLNDVILTCFTGIRYSIYVNEEMYADFIPEEEGGSGLSEGISLIQGAEEAAEDNRFDPEDIYSEVPEEEPTEGEYYLLTCMACIAILGDILDIDLDDVKRKCVKKCTLETDETLTNLTTNMNFTIPGLNSLTGGYANLHTSFVSGSTFTPTPLYESSHLKVKFKKLVPEAIQPKYATEGAAAFDFYSYEPAELHYSNPIVISTGLSVEIPSGYGLFIFSRSGQGFKSDVRLANCVGVIDSDYRGEIKIKLTKDVASWAMPSEIKSGDAIAQGVILPYPRVTFVEADELSNTERGTGGFGSTDSKRT